MGFVGIRVSELTRRALADGSTKLLWDVGSRGLSFLLTILLARSLGATGFGAFAVYWYTALVLAQLTDVGIHLVSLRTLSRDQASSILASAIAAKLALTSLIVVGAMLFSSSTLVLVLLTVQLLGSWVELFGVALRSRGLVGREGMMLALLRASWIATALASISRRASLEALALHMALASLCVLLVTVFLSSRALRPWGRASTRGVGRLLRQSLPLAATSVITLVYLRADLFIVSAIAGAHEAGVFQGAFRLFEACFVLSGGLAAGTFPLIASRFGTRDFRPLARFVLSWAVTLSLPPVLLFTFLSRPIVGAVYGAEFSEAAEPLTYLGVALVAVFANAATTHFLVAAGRMRRLVVAMLVRLSVGVILDLYLVPGLGAEGAAMAVAVAEWSLAAVSLGMVADLLFLPPRLLEHQEASPCS